MNRDQRAWEWLLALPCLPWRPEESPAHNWRRREGQIVIHLHPRAAQPDDRQPLVTITMRHPQLAAIQIVQGSGSSLWEACKSLRGALRCQGVETPPLEEFEDGCHE